MGDAERGLGETERKVGDSERGFGDLDAKIGISNPQTLII